MVYNTHELNIRNIILFAIPIYVYMYQGKSNIYNFFVQQKYLKRHIYSLNQQVKQDWNPLKDSIIQPK